MKEEQTMNTKTSVRHLNTTTGSAGSIKTWLASLGGALANLGPGGRGLVLLLAYLLVGSISVMMLFPMRVTPANAPAEVFSGERAMTHLPVIAREPHPQGSPALAAVRDYLVQELSASGLEVEVQKYGSLENVVARLHGSDPSGAIVILAHYDTVTSSPGAGDNSSTIATLVEIMRALAAGPVPRNDVIALFDDGEEGADTFAGTKAFVVKHPWMQDVRVAVSIDSAIAGFISMNEAGPKNNGWLVHALAQAYTGGYWMSMSGGGRYNSTPFINAGIPVLTLEDNYPSWQRHTPYDLPEIIRPASVQQLGEQTLSIARVLGALDLSNPWGEQETFFSLPLLGFIHYPQAWALPLAVTAAVLLLLAIGLGLWRGLVSWKGLAIALGAILVSAALAFIVINSLWKSVPELMGWQPSRLTDWPETIPPKGWLVVVVFDLLVLGLAAGVYLIARRWSGRENFSLMALLPFGIAGVLLAGAEPRTAFYFTWPVVAGALVWIVLAANKRKQGKWSLDVAAALSAGLLFVHVLPFVPGIVMADGMKSLAIIAAAEALLLGAVLPVVDGLLVRQKNA
jgi:hypothetical protein